MGALSAFIINSLGCLALTIRKYVLSNPPEGSRIGGSFKLVTRTEVDDATVQFAASKKLRAVQVWEGNFPRIRCLTNEVSKLLFCQQKLVVTDHLTCEAALRIGVALQRLR